VMLHVRPDAHLRSLLETSCLVVLVGPCVRVWVAFARSLCVCVRLELTEVIGRWARACACVHVWWQRDDYDDFTDRSVGGWYGGYQHFGGSLTASHVLGCGESQRPDARAPHSGRTCWCAAVLAVWMYNCWDNF
jgi:hypothetical protein